MCSIITASVNVGKKTWSDSALVYPANALESQQ